MKKSEIKARIEEIKEQLKYIKERDKVCCTFGCEKEEEELLAELEELNENKQEIWNKVSKAF